MGPLSGLRVVEMAGLGPAPLACMMLADLGAEVVRIDRPAGVIDPLPGAPVEHDPTSRGRRSVVLDLKKPSHRQAALALIGKADVLVEGYRPGVMERLGLGPDECLAANPKLVYGRMTGWGQDGPWAMTAGHDLNYISITGALHAMGRAGERPAIPLNLVGDYGGGTLFLLVGILSALFEVARSGKGQVVDAAIVDGVSSIMTLFHGVLPEGHWQDERGVNLLDSGCFYYDVYEAADGRHMAVAPLEQKFFDEMLRILGLSPDAFPDRENRANWPRYREVLAGVFRSRTQAEWVALFDGSDACVTPVLSLREAQAHPHLAGRGGFRSWEGRLIPAPAPRFSRSTSELAEKSPEFGGGATAVFADWGVAAPADPA